MGGDGERARDDGGVERGEAVGVKRDVSKECDHGNRGTGEDRGERVREFEICSAGAEDSGGVADDTARRGARGGGGGRVDAAGGRRGSGGG